MVHHGGAEGAEGVFENINLCVLCASAVNPSCFPLVGAAGLGFFRDMRVRAQLD
jgi:hypothetical protein